MAKQVREKLRPLYGKRVRVRGILSNFRAWQQNYREVGAACISQPEIDCEVVADHVWVLHVPHWQCHRDDVGRQVEFEAVVNRYFERQLGENNYGLATPGDLVLRDGGPCLNIPEPPPDDVPPPEQNGSLAFHGNGAATDAAQDDPCDVLRRVKAFVKAVGGSEAALRVVAALGDVGMDAVELARWVDAYCRD
jgi:hypothetical protein